MSMNGRMIDYIEERLDTKELKYSLEFRYLREWLIKLENEIETLKKNQSSTSTTKRDE